VSRRTNFALIAPVVVGLSIPLVQFWRADTLTRLHQCRREMPTSGDQDFESPCADMLWRRLGLAGSSVTQLEATLGPSWCSDMYELSGKLKGRPKCLQPAWSFYYLPKTGLGGGPNLVCWSRDGEICLVLVWLYTA
jgi:hypothetical protein